MRKAGIRKGIASRRDEGDSASHCPRTHDEVSKIASEFLVGVIEQRPYQDAPYNGKREGQRPRDPKIARGAQVS